MTDKFIVADLNDEKSKDIAAVLGNKTARKILDYLADNDATETQIAEALNDHKALLFSKTKGILAIPVTIYEDWNYKLNGAYVFSLDVENGFKLKGTVTHENDTRSKSEYYYSDWQSTIRRSLHMDDVLYTIPQRMIKMNSLGDIGYINKVTISKTGDYCLNLFKPLSLKYLTDSIRYGENRLGDTWLSCCKREIILQMSCKLQAGHQGKYCNL